MKPIRSACPSPGNCPGVYWPANLPPGHPLANRWLPCDCALTRQAAAYQAALPVEIRAKSFASFHVKEGNQEAFELARAFAQDPWGQDWYWLALIGANGRGKTHLAAAIINTLLDRGELAYLEKVPALLDWLRGGYSDPDESFDERLARIKDAPVLVLDDLGAETCGASPFKVAVTPLAVTWAQDKLLQIFDYRLEGRLPLVVTTNLLLEPTPRCPVALPPRLSSRLQDRRVARIAPILSGDERKATGKGTPQRAAASGKIER